MAHRKRISIVGAGHVGESCALFCAQRELGDVCLIDIVPDMPKGKGLDIMEGAPVLSFDVSVKGTGDIRELKGSDIVIITAGRARRPGMSRDDLLVINTSIVKGVAESIKEHAPDSFIIVVTNPLDVMAWVVKEVTGFPRERVVGMAGTLDASRFRAFIADELNISVKDVSAIVMGGHGDSMVPLVRYASVSGIPITELIPADRIDTLVDRTRKAGGEIVGLLGDGSAYVSPAGSVTMMAEAYIRDQRRVMGASAYLTGEYDISETYLGVPVVLSGAGLSKVIELELTKDEIKMLLTSALGVKEQLKKVKQDDLLS